MKGYSFRRPFSFE